MAVDPRDRPVLPSRMSANGHVVRAGWSAAELDPHEILLLSRTAGRWDLLAIPPEPVPSRAPGRWPPRGRRPAAFRPPAVAARWGGYSGGAGADRRVGHAGGLRPGDHRTRVCRFP
ncbi:DUF5994 family protein [Streptomyces sp. NPDC002677]|uniref:DUF5994 family protein n=1 Tax=Streptomyces sp. NPDC002677 TaxID=3154774 RepID=UPI00332403F2